MPERGEKKAKAAAAAVTEECVRRGRVCLLSVHSDLLSCVRRRKRQTTQLICIVCLHVYACMLLLLLLLLYLLLSLSLDQIIYLFPPPSLTHFILCSQICDRLGLRPCDRCYGDTPAPAPLPLFTAHFFFVLFYFNVAMCIKIS